MDKPFDRRKAQRINSSLALIYQVVLIAVGLILPRCYLQFYHSEINGLISSITQFLAFINICDFGISTVVASSLYKPLAQKDYEAVSTVLAYARRFFRFVGAVLAAYVVVLAFVLPGIVDGDLDRPKSFTVLLLLAMSISQFAQYFIGITYQILLQADQRSYVQLLVNGGTLILNTAVCVIMMFAGCDIRWVKLAASIVYLLRPVLMWWYVRRHYPLMRTRPDRNAVSQKRSGIIQHISYTIYENTDVAVLTVCSTLVNVSVYSVYLLVVSGIRAVILALTTGVQALFGNMIANGETENLRRSFDFYDWCVHTISVLLFTVAGVLAVPFVTLYNTDEGNAAAYRVPLFAVLITVAFAVNAIRGGMYNAVRAAGHYKQTQTASLIEALLNLGLSVVLVFRFGLIGVAIGTLVAALFFTGYEFFYLSKNIVRKPLVLFLRQAVQDMLTAVVMVASVWAIPVSHTGWGGWLLGAVAVFTVCAAECLLIQWIFSREHLRGAVGLLKKRG